MRLPIGSPRDLPKELPWLGLTAAALVATFAFEHFVVHLLVVLPTGEVITTGGKTVKNVTGYDLTKLMTGSEGTLGVITKILVRLIPKPRTNKGRIEIEYYTLPDLERIIQMITRKTVGP